MKRVPILALLLAFGSFAWAQDAANEVDVASPADAADVTEWQEDAAVPTSEDAADDATADPTAEPPGPAEASAPVPTPVVPAEVREVPAPPTAPAEVKATPAPVERAETPAESHTVVRGDTLWDLAGSYLKNPFLWPQIFEANRDRIENPRLIFPNQEFVIPSMEAAAALAVVPETPAAEPPAAEPVAAVESAPEAPSDSAWDTEAPAHAEDMDAAAAPQRKMIESTEDLVVDAPEDMDDKSLDEREAKKKKSMAVPGAGFMGGTADSFLADENWEYDGYVLRDRDQRMMISQGDVVFLNIGAASGVKPKMVANVYRVGKKVKDPFLKKKTGRMIKRVGSVIVTGQVTDEGCTAVVTNSLEPIRIGDIIKFAAK